MDAAAESPLWPQSWLQGLSRHLWEAAHCLVRSPLLGIAPLLVSCFISVQKTLSHRVHFTLVSFSNAMQTNFCLIAQTNKVHIGALKVMGCMDDDPGHSCGLLLRLCTICSTFTHPTFGCYCESCSPFPYSSSAEPIRLSVQLCLSIAPSCLGGHTAWQRKLLVCPEARETSLQASTKHGRCLMSLADGSCPASQQDSPCPAAVPPPPPSRAVLTLQEHSVPKTLHPSDCLFLSQCWSF